MNVLEETDAPGGSLSPTIYDVGIDEMRPVTQADVDRLLNAVNVMAKHREVLAFAEQMCRDALRGKLSIERYREITGALFHSYTSAEARQREADEREGRMLRHRRESPEPKN